MIRVLHVINRMGYGGIEAFLMNIYRNIDRNKIQFDFAVHTEKKGEYDEEIKKLGGNIYYFSSRRKGFFKYYNDWNNFLKMNAFTYSSIHMHVSSLTTILPIKLAKKYNIKNRIIHAHNTKQSGKIHEILNKINQFKIDKITTKLLACSTEAGKYVFGNNKFDLIHNGVELDKYVYNPKIREKIRKQKSLDDKFIITNISRFTKQKNHEFLLEIFREIYIKRKDAFLLLAGKGELENQIREKVKEMGIESNVLFLGTISNVNEILQATDIFLLPSIHEGLPVVGIEAQAAGLKVYTSENVSKELQISDMVKFISLSEPANIWAKIILDEAKYERMNMKEVVTTAGYDIKNTIEVISNIYIK